MVKKRSKKIVKEGKFFKQYGKVISIKNLVKELKISDKDNAYYYHGVRISKKLLTGEITKKSKSKFPIYNKKVQNWIFDKKEISDSSAQKKIQNIVKKQLAKSKKEIVDFELNYEYEDDIPFSSLSNLIYSKLIDIARSEGLKVFPYVNNLLKLNNLFIRVDYFTTMLDNPNEPVKKHFFTFFLTHIKENFSITQTIQKFYDMFLNYIYESNKLYSSKTQAIKIKSIKGYTIDKFNTIDIKTVSSRKARQKTTSRSVKNMKRKGITKEEVIKEFDKE